MDSADRDDRDERVKLALSLLERLVLASGYDRQDIDKRLGFSRGYTSRLLTGQIRLVHAQLLRMLDVLDIAPGDFFAALYPPRPRPVRRRPIDDVIAAFSRFRIEEPAPQTIPLTDPEVLRRALTGALLDVVASLGVEPPKPDDEPEPQPSE